MTTWRRVREQAANYAAFTVGLGLLGACMLYGLYCLTFRVEPEPDTSQDGFDQQG